ncbi:MAG: ABC transporter permease [Acidobacteria bacterium]|nr:MAG: ABC transporter permease [Acidobacteriota bacterium]
MSAASTGVAIPPGVERADRSERIREAGIKGLLLSPAFVWIAFLVLAPNIFLILYSLWQNELGTIVHSFSFENYSNAISSDVFTTLFVRTFLIASLAAALATLIAYPAAFLVVRKLGRWKLAAALLILVPLWVSYLLRVFAWRIILGEQGVLNGALTSTGILSQPSDAFLYSVPTVVLALTYIAIPYVFLASYTVLERIPPSVYEASADCGASAWRTFTRVVWPLSRPGVAMGFAIGFILAFGDYVTPQMVGGIEGTMLGSIIIQQFGTANDWPYGAAIAVTIMLTSLLFLALVSLFSRTEARYE